MPENLAHDLEYKERTKDVLIKENYNFDSLLLPGSILQGLKNAGFCKPSPVQIKAIPLGRCGLDLLVNAKSGTGKTAVFSVIALDMINTKKSNVQVLIIAPTREIAVQIEDVVRTIGKEFKELGVGCFIGGLALEGDIKHLKDCHIVVGTPGRLAALISKGHLKVNSVRLFVLDEADKLMETSFKNDINYIYSKLPERKQVLAMSATFADGLDEVLTKYMLSPTFVSPETDSALLLGLRQFVTVVQSHLNVMQQMKIKTDELVRLLNSISFTQCLIFSNYQTRAESISNTLNQKNWKSMYISGAQSQTDRLKVVNSLKKFECRIFLTTDLTARGIDASNVDVVINYDVPHNAATYMHRMGRAGRYGSRGLCITISATGKEVNQLQVILGEVGGSELNIAKLPEGNSIEDLWATDLNSFETIAATINNESSNTTSLKQSVFELKNLKSKTKPESDSVSQELEKLSVDENCEDSFDVGNVNDIIKNNENDRETIIQEYAEVDAEFLLKSLVSGKSVDDKLKNASTSSNANEEEALEESTVPHYLQWIPVEGPSIFNSGNTGVNLLESFDESDSESGRELKKIKGKASSSHNDNFKIQKDNVLTRNIALFNIADLLTSPHDDFDVGKHSEVVQSLDRYLNVLNKSEETITNDRIQKQYENSSCKDLLENIVSYTKTHRESDEVSDPLENIFAFGYDFMIKSGTHWIDMLGSRYEETEEESVNHENQDVEMVPDYDTNEFEKTDRTLEHFENTRSDYNNSENQRSTFLNTREHRRCEDRTSDYNYQNQECARNIQEYNSTLQHNFYTHSFDNNQVTNHESNFPAQNVNSNYLNHPNFNYYYNYYNETLRDTAPTFENVCSFNQWFSQWESQLDSLTSYIEQNIYLQEMNNYQYRGWYNQ